MKRIIFSAFLGLLWVACGEKEPERKDNGLQEVRLDEKVSNADIIRMPIAANGAVDSNQIAKIEFAETSYQFGTITEGAVVKHTFKFKNTGKAPLLITDIQTTCGCTVPDWNRNPIAPGAEDEVRVQFNSTGKEGAQVKRVTVLANTIPSETIIDLQGVVEKKSK